MSSKFSFSKIDTYESCPFKYKLQYVDGHYSFTGGIATDFGTLIHQTEEKIANLLIDHLEVNYVDIKNEFILKLVDIEKKYYDDFLIKDSKSGLSYKDKAFIYLKSGIYRLEKLLKNNKNLSLIAIEKKFTFCFDEEHVFTGAIDRILFDKVLNKYIIQDIKTYSTPKPLSELTTPLQFVVYSLAVKEMFSCNENDIICQYDLPLLSITQDCCTKGYLNRGIKKINKIFTQINSCLFIPKPSPLCNWCNFCKTNTEAPKKDKYLCPYFSIWNRETRNKFDINKVENTWTGLENYEAVLESYHKKYNILL